MLSPAPSSSSSTFRRLFWVHFNLQPTLALIVASASRSVGYDYGKANCASVEIHLEKLVTSSELHSMTEKRAVRHTKASANSSQTQFSHSTVLEEEIVEQIQLEISNFSLDWLPKKNENCLYLQIDYSRVVDDFHFHFHYTSAQRRERVAVSSQNESVMFPTLNFSYDRTREYNNISPALR